MNLSVDSNKDRLDEAHFLALVFGLFRCFITVFYLFGPTRHMIEMIIEVCKDLLYFFCCVGELLGSILDTFPDIVRFGIFGPPPKQNHQF